MINAHFLRVCEMNQENIVMNLIYKAFESLNAEREPQKQISVGPDTCLFGVDSILDSLSLVSVIVDIESLVSEQFDRVISLTDDRAMSRDPVPFTNVNSLKNYITEILLEQG